MVSALAAAAVELQVVGQRPNRRLVRRVDPV